MRKKAQITFLCFSIILALSQFTLAQTHVWDGEAGDGLWSSATNWNTNTVPSTGAHVKIDGGETVNLDMNVTIASVHSLGVNGGTAGTLIIDAGFTLTTTNRGVKIQNSASVLTINGTFTVSHADNGYHGINNAIGGTITVSSTGVVNIDDVVNGMGIYQNGGTLTNDGTILIDNIAIQAGINIQAGGMTNNGTLSFGTSITNTFALQGAISNTSTATVSGNSASSTSSINTDVSFNGATLSPNGQASAGMLSFRTGLTNNGVTSYHANVANDGGTLTNDQLYFFNGGAGNFDLANVDLVVSDIGGSALAIGDVFTVIDSQFGYTGTFNSVDTSSPVLPATSAWSVSYLTNSVIIEIISTLPVKMDYFQATLADNGARLDWQTRAESNNDRFEIERSQNAKDWLLIGAVTGNGTTNQVVNYTFEDHSPVDGINYYRLKQMDYDGKFEYSKMEFIWSDLRSNIFTISPNPTFGTFRILGSNNGFNASFKLMSLDGKTVMENLSVNREIEVSHLEAGVYLIIANRQKRRLVIRK